MIKKTLFFALFIVLAPITLLADSAQTVKNPSIYIVKKGDCLWTISKRVWGDPQKWPMLYATNQGTITNPNLIYPGQKFTIPTTITKEELQKATRLAEEKSAPIGVRVSGAEDTQVVSHKKHKVSSASEEAVSPSAASKEASASSEKAAPSASAKEDQPSPASAESTSGSGKIIALLLVLVALVGGVFFWMRSRSGPSELQAPKPLSSFPQAGEPKRPSVSLSNPPSTPFSTSQAYPAPSRPVDTPSQPIVTSNPSTSTPAQSAVNGSTSSPQTRSNPPVDKPSSFSGTITSVSISPSAASSTPPSLPKPVEPATQLPLTPPVSTPPVVQEPQSSSSDQAPGENKPSDTPPPSSSSNHAA